MRAATFATIGFSWNIILKTLWWIWFKAYSGNLMLIFSLIMKKDAKLILSSGRSTSIRDSIISNFIHQWNLLWIWQWGGINCFSLNLMVNLCFFNSKLFESIDCSVFEMLFMYKLETWGFFANSWTLSHSCQALCLLTCKLIVLHRFLLLYFQLFCMVLWLLGW